MRARVGLDLSCLEATPETGVERYARRLAEHLPRAAGDLDYVVLARPGKTTPAVAEPARVVSVPSIFPRPAWREIALPRALSRLGIDLLHAPMAAIPLCTTVPRIATIQDVPPFGAPGHEGRLSRNRLRLLHTLRAARRLIVPSLATRAALLAFDASVADRVRVIPHGVDPDFRPSGVPLNRERYQVPPEAEYFLWIGTVRERKDPLVLIRAFAAVADRHPNLHLLMCGDLRMDEAVLRAPLSGTSAGARFHLLGYVAREDLPDLYRESVCLVMPSLLEGFGLPALEAMSCGRPVLASEDGALMELIGDAGWTFPTGDATALAALMERLLKEPDEARRLAAAARRRAEAYSWEGCARAHADVYREVLAPAIT